MSLIDAFKTDIAHVGDLVKTPSGDLGTISGLANLKEALFHRLMTVPGTLVHRPTYGVGIPLYQGRLSSFSVQQRLASLIQEQFKQDPRVEDVKSTSVQSEDLNPQMTIITVVVNPVGYSEVALKFTPFVGGGL
jgi:phage baseplate assembly protein W